MHVPLHQFRVRDSIVEVYSTKRSSGRAAARHAAQLIEQACNRKGIARIIIGTGNSQLDVIEELVGSGVDWTRVVVFHMDEYVGMPREHAASFRRWLKEKVVEKTRPHATHYLNGDAHDMDQECMRYAALIEEAPIDVCFVGFGENGHIAFNDPHVADFHDPQAVKIVEMDEKCRRQQVGEGHFPTLEDVPKYAVTLTCPTLMSAEHLICVVPEKRKAEAVQSALEGPVSANCPGSIVTTHPNAAIYLDEESASLLAIKPQ